jgi:hypothetical protein
MQKPDISLSGSKGYGPLSPVQRGISWLVDFFADVPETDIGTVRSKHNGALIGNHLIHLLHACGLVNGMGYHSAAVSLLRSMEDALDCFAAVVLVRDAAEKWENDSLKASDAAKKWTEADTGIEAKGPLSLGEYRKYIRRDLNKYSHCTRELCNWNLYFNPKTKNSQTGSISGILELNTTPDIIDSNGHAIDAYETAHLLEIIYIVRLGYKKALQRNNQTQEMLNDIEKEIIEIMEKHNEHGCQDVRIPPELHRLK